MIRFNTFLFLCIFASVNIANGKRVSPEIQNAVDQGKPSSAIVECERPESPEILDILKQISEASQTPSTTRTDKVTNLLQDLQDSIFSFLEDIISFLDDLGVDYEVLWPSFEIFVREAAAEVIKQLAQMEIVKRIRPDTIIPFIPPISSSRPQGNNSWNIDLIDARCKGIKCFGEGVIIGFIDSGARATHKEIKDNWMGKDTPFGYLDGYNVSCTPTDNVTHGTHVVGSACGKNVGVAPSAKWTMCRGCSPDCSESRVKICAMWLACPYKCGDTSPTKTSKNCTARPHVINNSLGGLIYRMEVDLLYFLYEYIQLWNSLGIISFFAAGNDGPGCNTISIWAAYDIVFSVGAVDKNVTLADFSSVGPGLSIKPLTKESIAVGTCSSSKCGNQNATCALTTPTLVAPGVSINSSISRNDTAYGFLDGTSMATPHVSGVVALMLCANPTAKWNYKKAYEILTGTTNTSRIDLVGEGQNKNNSIHTQTHLTCNVMSSGICSFPNNMYGYGLIDACEAVLASTNPLWWL